MGDIKSVSYIANHNSNILDNHNACLKHKAVLKFTTQQVQNFSIQ